MQNSMATIIKNSLSNNELNSYLYFPSNTLFDLLIPTKHDFYTHVKGNNPGLATFVDGRKTTAIGMTINAGIINNIQQDTYKYTNNLDLLHANRLLIQHNLPHTNNAKILEIAFKTGGRFDQVLFTSEVVREKWGIEGDVLEYGFEQQEKVEKDIPILVAGNFGKDTKIVRSIMENNKGATFIGNNGGLTTPYRSLKELVFLMKKAQFTVCLSADLEPPLFAMLAMSCSSCPIVNRTPMTDLLIEEGQNGFFISNTSEIPAIPKSVSKSKITAIQEAALDTILEKYPKEPFDNKFNSSIESLTKKVYIR